MRLRLQRMMMMLLLLMKRGIEYRGSKSTPPEGWGMINLRAFGTKDLDGVVSHFIFQSHGEYGLAQTLHQGTDPEFLGGVLGIHGIQAVRGDDVAGMYEGIERAGTLREVGVIGIVGSDPVQDQIETIAKVRDAGAEAVEIEAIFDVGPFHLAEHFVSLQTAKPLCVLLVGWLVSVWRERQPNQQNITRGFDSIRFDWIGFDWIV